MFSAYSPFFNSGLLSAEGSSSRSPSPLSRRNSQCSLPNDTPASALLSSYHQSCSSAEPTAYYYSQQSRRNENAQLSFLSLDLAESKTLCTASQKRAQTCSKWSSWSSKPATIYTPSVSPTTRRRRKPAPIKTTLPSLGASKSPMTALRSARSIPSPKPAPSTTLPALPFSALPAPRLPTIPPTPPLSISTDNLPASVQRSNSLSPSSTVSTRCRNSNRSEALASLEGRKRAPYPRIVRKADFMSMSDDEDEDDESSRDTSERWLIKARSILQLAASESLKPKSQQSSRASTGRSRRRTTIDSWNPLRSFVDLKDEDAWKWPSFVEITHA